MRGLESSAQSTKANAVRRMISITIGESERQLGDADATWIRHEFAPHRPGQNPCVRVSIDTRMLGAVSTPWISGGLKTVNVEAVRRRISRFPYRRVQASGMWSLAR